MTILFAPSEGKREGGALEPIDKSAFLFPELYEKRAEAAAIYRDFVQNASKEKLQKLFGIKEPKLLERYKGDIFAKKTMKAVERYDGVAYDHLGYDSLPEAAQNYIDEHLIIFSNLFGPLKGGDRLPDYKLKQGERIGEFAPEKFYKKEFSEKMTSYLTENGPVIDLRAGFYEKFYTVEIPHITMKFLKNGKSVSHWAKAYRGRVLKEMAKRAIMDEESLLALDIENLAVKEIRQTKKRKEIIYEITE